MTPTPEVIDLLIESRWIAAVDPDIVLKNHAVAVHNGRIVALLPASEARARFKANERVTLDDHILRAAVHPGTGDRLFPHRRRKAVARDGR